MTDTSTVLIVDDEPVGRETLQAVLITQGYRLAFAANGAEALLQAAELMPDVILLDVMMPGTDGFEICRQLRADPRLGEIPVILVTALDDRDSRLRGIEAGADDFVSKPFDRLELRARVRTIARLNRYRRLMAERAKFERVVEQAEAGYLTLSDGGQIRYANSRARVYLGLPPEADLSIAETFLAVAAKQYVCEPVEAWANWPAPQAESTRYLVRPESSTARSLWLQVDVVDLPAGPDGGWLIGLRDVTAQLAIHREMWTFHSMLSHKMRAPVSYMLNSLDLLARHAAKLSPQEIADVSATALKGAQRLKSEMEAIFRYMRTPALAHSGAGFNLADLPVLAARISLELGLANVDVVEETELGEVALALSRQAMESVLWELLENAKKFHPNQTPCVQVAVSRPQPDKVSIRVSDDGITLSPEQLSRAGLPYYQGEKYFTGEAAGMGLGLSMVTGLMWGVGGMCRIYNRDDRSGVVVELIVPLAPAAEA